MPLAPRLLTPPSFGQVRQVGARVLRGVKLFYGRAIHVQLICVLAALFAHNLWRGTWAPALQLHNRSLASATHLAPGRAPSKKTLQGAFIHLHERTRNWSPESRGSAPFPSQREMMKQADGGCALTCIYFVEQSALLSVGRPLIKDPTREADSLAAIATEMESSSDLTGIAADKGAMLLLKRMRDHYDVDLTIELKVLNDSDSRFTHPKLGFAKSESLSMKDLELEERQLSILGWTPVDPTGVIIPNKEAHAVVQVRAPYQEEGIWYVDFKDPNFSAQIFKAKVTEDKLQSVVGGHEYHTLILEPLPAGYRGQRFAILDITRTSVHGMRS